MSDGFFKVLMGLIDQENNMKVLEPGHIYQLDVLDGNEPQKLVFVNREEGTEHPGTQTQEVLRVLVDMIECLIDRTNHCDACLRWEGNDRIIKALSESQRQMRRALLFHEQRALERKMERGDLLPEKMLVAEDGHWVVKPTKPADDGPYTGPPHYWGCNCEGCRR